VRSADIKSRRSDNAVVLETLRGLSQQISDKEQPILDRLFALECSIRAGTPTRAVTANLGAAMREAEWRISDDWEEDVPHAAELGQAMSTSAAAGADVPAEWSRKLMTTIDRLSARRTKFNLDTDPVLLAAVIRGLGAVDERVPAKILEASRTLLNHRPAVVLAAELAEAFSRHRDQEGLAKEFAATAFASTAPVDMACASARWWLAERWTQNRGNAIPVDPKYVREARLVVLSSPSDSDFRARAMAVEAVGRSVDRLIVDTPDNIGATQAGRARRLETELYVLRATVAIAAAVLVMFNINLLVSWIDSATGVSRPSALVFQGIFGLGSAVIAYALVNLVASLVRLHRGIDMPNVQRAAEVFIPLAAGLIAAILHQG
jgi:hypothetical protein